MGFLSTFSVLYFYCDKICIAILNYSNYRDFCCFWLLFSISNLQVVIYCIDIYLLLQDQSKEHTQVLLHGPESDGRQHLSGNIRWQRQSENHGDLPLLFRRNGQLLHAKAHTKHVWDAGYLPILLTTTSIEQHKLSHYCFVVIGMPRNLCMSLLNFTASASLSCSEI